MINIHEYFAVNWEATSDNIRGLMNGVISKKVLAAAMCVTERTIYNWCHNKAHPGLDELVLLAKFFNLDILDILVTNGQIHGKINYEDVEEAIERERRCEEALEKDWERQQEWPEYDCICSQGFDTAVLMHEYHHRHHPIKTLEDFLLCLPLFPFYRLHDALNRIDGNLGTGNGRSYMLKQLAWLYEGIQNEEAKRYVELYQKYHMKYPKISLIDDETDNECKLNKLQEWEKDFKELMRLSDSYDEKRKQFIEKLKEMAKPELDAILEGTYGDL